MRRIYVLAVGVLAAWALAVPGATSASPLDVGSGSDIDAYSLSASPGTAASGTTVAFTLTVRNDPGNAEPASGADVIAPAGFHVLSASLQGGAGGTARVSGHVVHLLGLTDNPGQPLNVRLKAKVPVRCHRAGYTWKSSAWEDDSSFPGGHEPLTPTSSAPTTIVAGGCLRHYSVQISPGTVTGGKAAQLKFSLRNDSSGGIALGSADFSAPRGFKVLHASLISGERGSASSTGGAVHLRGLKLKSARTLKLTVTVLPAELCGSASYRWSSTARSGGRSLGLRSSSSRRTTRVATTCALRFTTQPHNAVVDQTITGADYSPSGPPVSVEVVDGFGNVIKSSTAPITIGLARNPGGSTLGGTATAKAVAGVASFAGLSLDRAQNKYVLFAGSPGSSGANSSPFDENDTENPCLQNVSCQTGLTNAASQMSVTATPDTSVTNSGSLSESVDVGTPLNCSGYAQEDPHWYEFFMSSTNRSKTLTYVIKQPAIPLEGTVNAILALTQFCLAAPYEFTTASGAPAPAATLPDGSSGFVGLLPNCPAVGTPNGPCIASKTSQLDLNNTLGFDIVLTIFMPEGLAGDPMGRA